MCVLCLFKTDLSLHVPTFFVYIADEHLVMDEDASDFFNFQCSFIICDVDEEELTSNDSNTVDLDKFKPHFPLKRSL